MIASITTLLELQNEDVQQKNRPLSSLAFDWMFVGLAVLFMIGIMQDVWSHRTFGPDQSVLSEYHLLFYASAATMGFFLLWTHLQNVNKGFAWRYSLPIGYGFAFLGIVIFGITGVFDLIGHALWGFETGIEALTSPTHMLLFISGAVLTSAPMVAMFERQRRGGAMSLINSIPGLLGFTNIIIAFTLMTQHLAPISGLPHMVQAVQETTNAGQVAVSAGVAGIYMQTAIIFGLLLWLIRHIRLSRGSILVIFIIFGLMCSIQSGNGLMIMPLVLIGGIITEIMYYLLQPDPQDILRFRSFGALAPIVFWLGFYGFFMLTNIGGGIWFTEYVWTGSVFHAGIIGLALAYLMTMQPVQSGVEGK